jgi:hypothetical protein
MIFGWMIFVRLAAWRAGAGQLPRVTRTRRCVSAWPIRSRRCCRPGQRCWKSAGTSPCPVAGTSWRQARKPNLSARLQRRATPFPPRLGRAHPCCSLPPWLVRGRCPGAAMLTRLGVRCPLITQAGPRQRRARYPPATSSRAQCNWSGLSATRCTTRPMSGSSPCPGRPDRQSQAGPPAEHARLAGPADHRRDGGRLRRHRRDRTAHGSRSCPTASRPAVTTAAAGERTWTTRHRRRPGHAQEARRAWRRGAL